MSEEKHEPRPLLVFNNPANDWLAPSSAQTMDSVAEGLKFRLPTDEEILAQPCVVEALKNARSAALADLLRASHEGGLDAIPEATEVLWKVRRAAHADATRDIQEAEEAAFLRGVKHATDEVLTLPCVVEALAQAHRDGYAMAQRQANIICPDLGSDYYRGYRSAVTTIQERLWNFAHKAGTLVQLAGVFRTGATAAADSARSTPGPSPRAPSTSIPFPPPLPGMLVDFARPEIASGVVDHVSLGDGDPLIPWYVHVGGAQYAWAPTMFATVRDACGRALWDFAPTEEGTPGPSPGAPPVRRGGIVSPVLISPRAMRHSVQVRGEWRTEWRAVILEEGDTITPVAHFGPDEAGCRAWCEGWVAGVTAARDIDRARLAPLLHMPGDGIGARLGEIERWATALAGARGEVSLDLTWLIDMADFCLSYFDALREARRLPKDLLRPGTPVISGAVRELVRRIKEEGTPGPSPGAPSARPPSSS